MEKNFEYGNIGIRSETWEEMGTVFGGLIGKSIGLGMDLFVLSVSAMIIEPLALMTDLRDNH